MTCPQFYILHFTFYILHFIFPCAGAYSCLPPRGKVSFGTNDGRGVLAFCRPARRSRDAPRPFLVIPTSSRQGAMADGALRLPPRPQRLPLLFPKSSSILFGSPVKATKRRDLVQDAKAGKNTALYMASPLGGSWRGAPDEGIFSLIWAEQIIRI